MKREYRMTIGSRGWGPEIWQSGLSNDLHVLRLAFQEYPFETATDARPGYFFEVQGRFSEKRVPSGLGRSFLYKDGSSHVEVHISEETLSRTRQEMREEVVAYLRRGAHVLSDRLVKKYPNFESEAYLAIVDRACEALLSSPITKPTIQEWLGVD
jgi:hypothetical protein